MSSLRFIRSACLLGGTAVTADVNGAAWRLTSVDLTPRFPSRNATVLVAPSNFDAEQPQFWIVDDNRYLTLPREHGLLIARRFHMPSSIKLSPRDRAGCFRNRLRADRVEGEDVAHDVEAARSAMARSKDEISMSVGGRPHPYCCSQRPGRICPLPENLSLPKRAGGDGASPRSYAGPGASAGVVAGTLARDARISLTIFDLDLRNVLTPRDENSI